MIKTTGMLLDELKKYASPADKIARMVREGKLTPVVKGLYETDKEINSYLLAGSIYGPSYLSFEYALSEYGLIPETVYVVTCATFEKKKKKRYETPFGVYTYRDVPSAVFSEGVEIRIEGEYAYKIATPEKALCDQLYKIRPLANYRELENFLFKDMRIDMDAFSKLAIGDIELFAEKYGSRNVKKLAGYMRRY